MIHGKKILVVLPAFRAERTLERTCAEVPRDVVDAILLVDDGSDDKTMEIAERMGVESFLHLNNLGYGANQKTCYREALRAGADVVVMLHPDYQYDPRLVGALAAMVASGVYDVALG
jgi:glycosyltransferase involved in cell wall biosynthesis